MWIIKFEIYKKEDVKNEWMSFFSFLAHINCFILPSNIEWCIFQAYKELKKNNNWILINKMITKDCQNNKHIYLLYILNMWNILRHLSNLLININGITKYYSENINTARIRMHHVLDRYRFLFLPPVTYRRPRLRAHFATPDTFRCEGKNRRRNHRSFAQSAYEFASRSRVTHSRSSIIDKRSPPRGRKTPRCPLTSPQSSVHLRLFRSLFWETLGRPFEFRLSFETRKSGAKCAT